MLYNYGIYRSKEFSKPKMSLLLHLELSATAATCQWYKIFSFVHSANKKQKLDMNTTLNAIWTQKIVWYNVVYEVHCWSKLAQKLQLFHTNNIVKVFFCDIQPVKIFPRRDFYLGNGQQHNRLCKNLTANTKSHFCF